MTDAPAPIGHNAPPKLDAYSMALDDAYTTAKDFLDGKPIENQGQADAVGRIVGEVKKLKKDADDARAEEKRPHDEAAKAVQAKWKPLLERAETIIKAAQKPLSDYLNKLAAEQREAEEKAREEAARKAQEAVEASRAAEGSIEAVEHARALEKDADKAQREAAKLGKQKAHVTGMDRAIGLRTYKVATVTDRKAALLWIAKHDPEALEQFVIGYANAHAPTRPMDGVEVTVERKVA